MCRFPTSSAHAAQAIWLRSTQILPRRSRFWAGKQKSRWLTCAATAGTGRARTRPAIKCKQKAKAAEPSPFSYIDARQKAARNRGLLFSCRHSLFSRPVTRQVFSAIVSLTSVFGMGTGGPSRQSTPTVKKKPDRNQVSLCWHYLFSRPVTRQVFSANMSLTSVFGMGTGGPSCQSTPTIPTMNLEKTKTCEIAGLCVGTIYFPGQSPGKYRRRIRA